MTGKHNLRNGTKTNFQNTFIFIVCDLGVILKGDESIDILYRTVPRLFTCENRTFLSNF